MDVTAATIVAVLSLTAALVLAVVARRARHAAADARADVARLGARQADAEAASRETDRLLDGFAVVEQGLVLYDGDGHVVLRNARAEGLLTGTAGGALVAATLDRLVEEALAGRHAEEVVDLFGPPRRTLRVVAEPLDRDGGVTGVLIVIEDVSERRHLESVRRDFVANISHELKTPIGALGLLAETLVDEHDPEVARRLAERMQDEAIRVGRIIEDLLDLSRIESDELPVREPVPVHAVLDEATERLGPAAEHRGVRLDVERVDRSLTVLGERRQLVSAVHSLVENALTYTDPGGHVTVGATATDGRVSIAVVDTGVGIPARDLDRIFERFYRVDRARARATGGTGLGLSIVRNVATNHGGEVHVQSHEGVGSTFTLDLPAGPAYSIPTGEAV